MRPTIQYREVARVMKRGKDHFPEKKIICVSYGANEFFDCNMFAIITYVRHIISCKQCASFIKTCHGGVLVVKSK